MNKGQFYNRIQALSYELDLMYENKAENAQAIFDFELEKAKLEEELEFAEE